MKFLDWNGRRDLRGKVLSSSLSILSNLLGTKGPKLQIKNQEHFHGAADQKQNQYPRKNMYQNNLFTFPNQKIK